ncbi:hypothetical protein F4553_003941 [Allocatelliglobosispora scoriae]|uniref:DUF2516 family protein n=1 Tax=Allocatelliglobosispora scoriae TaxID=643052 RepID=A0A841BUY8_9ACTN|nr:DUF2516 family protein [Allocatelliglobosispora scoriae]MBB5870562.1 hypothetical protein [Allocatelliglobosispora scoriae]
MFYENVMFGIDAVLVGIMLALTVWAIIHCVAQRPDAFTAIGTLPKGGWLGLLIVGVPIMIIFGVAGGISVIPLGLIFTGCTLFYLLDVRAGIKELLEGRW